MSQLARTVGQDVEAKTPSKPKRRVEQPPAYAGSARPVQGSEWMVYVRDHDIDITMNEWGLATLYGTYGNWGQWAYPSDNWIAKKLHIKAETVSRARKSLLAKGLIRCIGQAPNGQPNQFAYCLTLPIEVSGSSGDPLVEGVTPEMGYGTPRNGIRVTPETGNGYPRNGDQHLEQIEGKLEPSTSQPDGDGGGIGPSAPGGQAPQTPQDPGLDRDLLADALRAKIRPNVWSWASSLASEYGPDAVIAAAQQSAEKGHNPPAYFLRSAEDICSQYRAAREARVHAEEDATEAGRLADEIESYRERYVASSNAPADMASRWFDKAVRDRRERHLPDAEVLEQIKLLIETAEARRAAEAA
jgi:hypothetical protein